MLFACVGGYICMFGCACVCMWGPMMDVGNHLDCSSTSSIKAGLSVKPRGQWYVWVLLGILSAWWSWNSRQTPQSHLAYMWAAGDLNSGPHACQQALELLSQPLNPIYIVSNFKRRKGNSQSTSEGLYLKEEPGPVWPVRGMVMIFLQARCPWQSLLIDNFRW